MALTIEIPNDEPLELMDLTPLWTVSQLKERLSTMVGMPASKQKLVTVTGVALRNTYTLALSGLKSGDRVTLSAKERGGKK